LRADWNVYELGWGAKGVKRGCTSQEEQKLNIKLIEHGHKYRSQIKDPAAALANQRSSQHCRFKSRHQQLFFYNLSPTRHLSSKIAGSTPPSGVFYSSARLKHLNFQDFDGINSLGNFFLVGYNPYQRITLSASMSDTESSQEGDSSASSSNRDQSENSSHSGGPGKSDADAGEPRPYVPPKGVFTETQETLIQSFAEQWNALRTVEQDARAEPRAALLTLIVKELQALPQPPHAENLPLVYIQSFSPHHYTS
jgi:hypothetical protein